MIALACFPNYRLRSTILQATNKGLSDEDILSNENGGEVELEL